MASLTVAAACVAPTALVAPPAVVRASPSKQLSLHQQVKLQTGGKCCSRVQAVAGDVSAEGTNFLILGAVGIALVGTAFPIFFARKDTCPVCDGAGFVRATDDRLNANFATKANQVVCKNCNGLGKLNQTDKK